MPYSVFTVTITFVVLGFLISPVRAAEREPPAMAPRRDLSLPSFGGAASIAVNQTEVRAGEPVELDLTFDCTTGVAYLHNPFFDPKLPSPARLAVFSSDRAHLLDIVAHNDVDDWVEPARVVLIHDGHVAGARFLVRTTASPAAGTTQSQGEPKKRLADRSATLPPGVYHVQAFYNQFFFADNWRVLGRFSGPPINIRGATEPEVCCASNVITFEVKPPIDSAGADNPFPRAAREKLARTAPGTAALKLTRKRVKHSDWVEAELRFVNTSAEYQDAFDPFLRAARMSWRPAGELLLLKSTGEPIGNVLAHRGGSSAGAAEHLWTNLPPGAIIGTRQGFHIGDALPPQQHLRLPAGKYRLQAVYFDRFLSPNPFDPPEQGEQPPRPRDAFAEAAAVDDWRRNFPGNVLLTSNVEHFELAEEDAPKK